MFVSNQRFRVRHRQVPVFGGFLLGALSLRAFCDFDRGRFFIWLGSGAACFLLARIVWAPWLCRAC